MRKRILIPSLVAVSVMLSFVVGCGLNPTEPKIQDLDFTGFEDFIRNTDIADESLVTVEYQEIGGVYVVMSIETPVGTITREGLIAFQQAEKAEADTTDDKNGLDDTEINVTWSELKIIYN